MIGFKIACDGHCFITYIVQHKANVRYTRRWLFVEYDNGLYKTDVTQHGRNSGFLIKQYKQLDQIV